MQYPGQHCLIDKKTQLSQQCHKNSETAHDNHV
jgi:hypothetical protein